MFKSGGKLCILVTKAFVAMEDLTYNWVISGKS